VTVSSGTLTIDSIPVATGFSLNKAGAGTLALTGSVVSRLSGDLNVTGGVLQIGNQDFYASGLTGGAIVENGSAITRWLYIANATDKVFDGVLRNGSNSGNLGFFKSGNGTLTLTGANDYNDTTTVAAGKLVFSGTTNNTREANVVGNTAASNAVLVISPNSTFGSNYNSGQIYSSSMTVGTNATAAGSIEIGASGGTLTVNRQLAVGTTGYGSLNQAGGSTTIGGFLALGGSANGGVVNQSGGIITLSAAPITIGFAETAGNAVVNLSGNAVFNVNGAAGNGVWVGEFGTGVLNVSGGALLSVPNDGIVLGKANSSLSSGVVNLRGGTILVKSVSKGTGGGSFNFDGGTLMPNAPNTTFMEGLTSAQVFSGGAHIDTNGVNVTIAQPLLAPTGSGVSASGLAVSGGGYIDTPIVQISGTGSGATAVASIDSSGNLTAITMTNPGVDYTEVPTFTLVGGGIGNTGSISGTATLVANTSGGLTKSGMGALTLSGANSYTGDTRVSAGTLSLSNGNLADAADVRLSAGAVLDLTFAAGAPDVVDELYIDGVQQADGVWGAIGSGAAHESASITGSGQLKVTTGGQDAYGTWASAKGLTPGVNDGKGQDPDGDGQNNLGEFAFDSNPLSGASDGKIVGKVATVGANQVLTLTLPVRSGAVFSGATEQVSAAIDSIIYQIQGSDDLSVFDLIISEVTGGDSTPIQAGLPTLSSGWSYRTFRTPGTMTDGDPKDFIRAKVSH
jgi:autotransporter-associated beta strand protein